jgi:MFS family permease
MAISESVSYQEITSANGRVYRVGEDPKDILGRSRGYMVWLPWVAMMAAGVFEYAYGSAAKTLQATYGWGDTETFTLTGVWGFFQAGIALPAGRLREKKLFSPRAAMLTGSVLCLIAFVTLGNTGNLVLNIIGYGVLGGIGTGLVYATCINITGKWFPEKKGGRVGFVNGGFGYGSIPFIIIFSYWFSVSDHRLVLSLVGVYMLILMGVCGWLFKDPPENWWPADVDPENWTKDQAASKNLKRNPPAARQFTWHEAIRTWQIWVMWVALIATSGVSFFGISYEVKFAKASDFAVYVAVLSAVLLALVNGTGRGAVGWLSDRLGRKQTLLLICVILGLAQYGVGWSGSAHNQTLFFVFAVISGFGSGAFYPMFAIMTPDYFGENYNASNYGTVYSGKLIGAVCAGPLAAALIDANGYPASYVLAGSLSLLAGVLVLFLRRPTAKAGTGAPAQVTKVPAQAPAADGPAKSGIVTEE